MNRDKELELLLSKLRNAKPTEPQMSKWQGAVQAELAKTKFTRKPHFSWTAQMAAILATGFILGVLSSRHFGLNQENNEPVATAQYIFSKSE